MFSTVGNLRVNCPNAFLVSGALGDAESPGVALTVPQVHHAPAVAQCRRSLQSEVDPHSALAGRPRLFGLTGDRDVPAPSGVLREGAANRSSFDVSAFPEPVSTLQVDDRIAVDADSPRDERHPPELSSRPRACSKTRASPFGITRRRERTGHDRRRVGVNAKRFRCTPGRSVQLDRRGPSHIRPPGSVAPLNEPLTLAAKVPHLVDRKCVGVEVLACGRVFDAKPVCPVDEHAVRAYAWSVARRKLSQDTRRGRHCIFALHVHLVFVTKYRRDVLSEASIETLRGLFQKVCADFGAELTQMSGEDDHVHLLVSYPPKVALSKLVNSLKGASSRRLRRLHPEVAGRYRKGVLWSASYLAASCGGAPLKTLKRYVENQRTEAELPLRPKGRRLRSDVC